jgi:hypothetical protein
MCKRVEDFIYQMLTTVFNAGNTAPLAIEAILAAGSCNPGTKAERLEDPAEWTPEKIAVRARSVQGDKGAAGNFDD